MSSDTDWAVVIDRARDLTENPLTPVSYDTLADALEEVGEVGLPGDSIENAVSEGILNEHGEGLDTTYSFNPEALADDNEDDGGEDKLPTPIETGLTDLPTTLTVDNDGDWPEYMTARDEWVLGLFGEKMPRAPWTGTGLYPCKWAAELSADERPENTYEAVCRWVEKVNRGMSLPTPDHLESIEAVPAYMLRPSEDMLDDGDVLLFIDWDDVRDPETGEVVKECRDWLEKLNSVTEVSSSGTGLHTFVVVSESMDMTSLAEDLHSEGKVEIYQTKRFASMTGEFIKELPSDVARADEVVEEIIDEYHDWHETPDDIVRDNLAKIRGDDSASSDNSSDYVSSYYDVDCTKLILNPHKVGSEIRGGHPHHGANSRNNNIAVTSDGQMWRCYQDEHGSGGNALHLVAVCEGYISCTDAGGGCLDPLTDIEYAKMCMDARDQYDGFRMDMTPPYRAVLGTAKAFGLVPERDDKIPSGLYDVCLNLYHDHSATDLYAL